MARLPSSLPSADCSATKIGGGTKTRRHEDEEEPQRHGGTASECGRGAGETRVRPARERGPHDGCFASRRSHALLCVLCGLCGLCGFSALREIHIPQITNGLDRYVGRRVLRYEFSVERV